jgi:peroxiredoxin
VAQVEPRPEVPGALADITLVNADSEEVRLGELWAERPVVLIHLRHFGCILCRHYAGALRDFHGDFEALGARLVAVGTGGRQYARDFVAERKIPYLVLVDKTMASHEVIRTKQGPLVGIFKPKVLWAALKARRAGERQGKTGPNPFKFGAAHVIGPGEQLHYAWINDDYHDNAPVEALLEAAAAAAGRAGAA